MPKKKRSLPAKLLRLMAWILLSVVVAASTGVVLLDQLVTPEWLRTIIVEQLRETFHRPVKIKRINVLLHQGIKVSGLEVSESEDFSGGTFLSSDFLIAKYSLAALLRGRIELTKAVLMAPRITLVRRSDGIWNLQDMLRPSGTQAPKGRLPALPPLQAADVISIERGELRLKGLAEQSSVSISDFRLLVRDFNTSGPFAFQVSFVNNSRVAGRSIRADIDLKGKMSLADKGEVAAERLRVVLDGQALSASGTFQGFSLPAVDLKLNLPAVDSALLARYFQVPEGIRVPPSRWALKAALERSNGQEDSPARLRLERAEASAGDLRVSARGLLAPGGDSRLSVDLPPTKVDDAAGFYEGWSRKGLSGSVSGELTFTGPLSALALEKLGLTLKSFSADLRKGQRISEADIILSGRDGLREASIAASRGTYVGYSNALTNLVADLRVQDGDMAVRRLEFTWNGSRAKLAGCVKNLAAPKQVTLSAAVDKLRVDELYATIENIIAQRKAELGQPQGEDRPWARVFKYSIPANFPDFKGFLRVEQAFSPNFTTKNLELLWDLQGISKGLRDVRGDARISFGDGQVSDVAAVRAAHRLLNVLLLPYTYMHELNAKAVLSLDTATPKVLDFGRIAANFSVRKGVADVHSLDVEGGQFVAFADGKMDFPGEKLDMRVLMRLPRQRGQLPDRMVDTLGRPSLELLLKDDLNKPTPTVTFRKIGAGELEEALAKGLKRGRTLAPAALNLNCGAAPRKAAGQSPVRDARSKVP